MGVPGLLPMLKEHLEDIPVDTLRDSTVGVDGSSWMYKAVSMYAVETYLQPDSDGTINLCVSYIIKKCKSLMHSGIRLYFVFDGEEHPMKKETNERRKRRKEEAKRKVEEFLLRGRRTEAYAMMSRCLTVSSKFLTALITELDDRSIPYIRAPYEADPQLAYLERIGVIEYIATEDSDLIVYGSNKVLFKLNENRGVAQLYNREKILSSCDRAISVLIRSIKEIVSLSGCDYTEGIKKIGLISANKLIMAHGTAERVIDFLSRRSKEALLHKEQSRRVICTFTFHVVSDPHSRKRRYFEEVTPPETISLLEEVPPLERASLFEDLSFVGVLHTPSPRIAYHTPLFTK
ncbi:exonuclease 1 [Nematocida sp. LUAm3]|nr:exonuclease 1 [Nematocida sp. LUAm3]KAI5173562.1 exonuclease 1 [Nematocida sp. LUAm2]KAI5176783.1 exonuclease 1 [Nematocida sp. LUAm1]